jgi:hypothetical protein
MPPALRQYYALSLQNHHKVYLLNPDHCPQTEQNSSQGNPNKGIIGGSRGRKAFDIDRVDSGFRSSYLDQHAIANGHLGGIASYEPRHGVEIGNGIEDAVIFGISLK